MKTSMCIFSTGEAVVGEGSLLDVEGDLACSVTGLRREDETVGAVSKLGSSAGSVSTSIIPAVMKV